jgi:hypothetical protein
MLKNCGYTLASVKEEVCWCPTSELYNTLLERLLICQILDYAN